MGILMKVRLKTCSQEELIRRKWSEMRKREKPGKPVGSSPGKGLTCFTISLVTDCGEEGGFPLAENSPLERGSGLSLEANSSSSSSQKMGSLGETPRVAYYYHQCIQSASEIAKLYHFHCGSDTEELGLLTLSSQDQSGPANRKQERP